MTGKFWNWTARGRGRQPIVLLYHRIARPTRDPWSLCVHPDQFAAQMSALRKVARPIPLRDVAEHARGGADPAVAITFDDAYDDILLNAEPILRGLEIPATVFVVGGSLDNEGEFWWDDLERILLEPTLRNDQLRIRIRGVLHEWRLGPETRDVDESRWRAWEGVPPTQAHHVYRKLYDLIFPLDFAEREDAMADLRRWAGVETPGRPTHRAMNRLQVETLARSSSLIDFGAHTMSHSCLSELPARCQAEEVSASKAAVESATGRDCEVFSYPYGKPEHFTAETAAIVRDAGFRMALTNVPGTVRPDTDLYRIPRVVAPALDGGPFVSWLRAVCEE